MLLAIEISLTAIAFTLAYVAPELGANWFEKWERRFGNLARRRALAVLSVGTLALLARAALLPIIPVPEPAIHDEFSHLLLADTLAHGRSLLMALSNRLTPCGFIRNFSCQSEADVRFHVLSRTRSISGCRRSFRRTSLLGSVAQCRGDVRRHLLDAARLVAAGLGTAGRLIWQSCDSALFSYWANTYFGGAVAAIGGALVLGALPRIKRKPAGA